MSDAIVMDPVTIDRQADSAWGDLAAFPACARPRGALGVHLDLVDDACIAAIMVRSGREAALAARVADLFGSALPAPGRVAFARDVCLVWSAQGQWLAVGHDPESLAGLAERLAGIASVVDLGDSRALVRIRGPRARDALAKGVAVDLHPGVFAVGATAITKVALVSVQLWQIDAAPIYVLAAPRSFAASVRSWLGTACAAYGYDVAPASAKEALFERR